MLFLVGRCNKPHANDSFSVCIGLCPSKRAFFTSPLFLSLSLPRVSIRAMSASLSHCLPAQIKRSPLFSHPSFLEFLMRAKNEPSTPPTTNINIFLLFFLSLHRAFHVPLLLRSRQKLCLVIRISAARARSCIAGRQARCWDCERWRRPRRLRRKRARESPTNLAL